MARTIIHVDLDAFFCAVEELHDPTLRGKAFAVGGRPDGRGVVASCSYAARRYGVRSAMSMATALRLCPPLLAVPVRHGEYRRVSGQVMEILRSCTPLLEQLSIDEAFLDVTELVTAGPGSSGESIALGLQERIFQELGLSCSVGVASNKMVAKIATDCGKAEKKTALSPRAICVVPPGEEATFLHPLPVTALWGVGPKTAERLKDLGIRTIGQLADQSERDLLRRFGVHGYELALHARGIDKREVVTEREAKSISSETTFNTDVDEWEDLCQALRQQATSVAEQLNKQGLKGSTIKVKLRWTDFRITTRQITLPHPTANVEVLRETATQLLMQLWQNAEPVRLLGVGIAGLNPVQQLSLWDTEEPEAPLQNQPPAAEETENQKFLAAKRLQLQAVISQLETRFGPQVVKTAVQISGTDTAT